MTITQTRQPAGAPTGGQFAPTARPEPAVSFDYPPDPPLPPGVTEDDRVYYSSQHCEQLAQALHDATGWPFAAVCDGYDQASDRFGWVHLAVMAPGGRVLDINGLHDPDDVIDQYGDWSDEDLEDVQLVIDKTATRFAGATDPTTAEDRTRAGRVASALLAHHRPEE